MKAFLGTVFMAALAVGLVSSCDEADELADCQKVCKRYGDCFGNKDYDVGSCRNKCEMEADKDKDYAKKLDVCEVCIEGLSCAASFGCTVECAGIISVANSTQ